ncbi:MAG: aldo/keto reductase, partial [Rubripirellula sp.]
LFDTYQIPYSCLAPEHHELITSAGKQNGGVIVRGGIAQGGPEATIQRPQLNDVWQSAALDDYLGTNMTRAQLILRYTLSHPHCHTSIVGTCNEKHLSENIEAASLGALPIDLYTKISERVAGVLRE